MGWQSAATGLTESNRSARHRCRTGGGAPVACLAGGIPGRAGTRRREWLPRQKGIPARLALSSSNPRKTRGSRRSRQGQRDPVSAGKCLEQFLNTPVPIRQATWRIFPILWTNLPVGLVRPCNAADPLDTLAGTSLSPTSPASLPLALVLDGDGAAGFIVLARARATAHPALMRTLRLLLPLLALVIALPVFAQTPSAEQILTNAKAQAAEQHKQIFLMFDASW